MRCIILDIDGLGIGKLPDVEDFEQEDIQTERIDLYNLKNFQKYGLSYLLNSKSNTEIESSFGRAAIKSNVVSLRTSLWEATGIVTISELDNVCKMEKDDLLEIDKDLQIVSEINKIPKNNQEKIFVSVNDNNTIIILSKDEIKPRTLNKIIEKLLKKFNIDEILFEKFEVKNSKIVIIEEKKIYNKKLDSQNLFSHLTNFGYTVYTIGKIGEFFQEKDITHNISCNSDEKVFKNLIDLLDDKFDGVVFAFFSDYYKNITERDKVLKKLDNYLSELIDHIKDDDIIFITSTTGIKISSYKRVREYVPIIVKGNIIKEDTYIGVRHSLADMAQTITDLFGINKLKYGKSFKKLIMEG